MVGTWSGVDYEWRGILMIVIFYLFQKVREHFPFPLMQNGSIAFYFSLDDALWSDWRNARLHRYSVL